MNISKLAVWFSLFALNACAQQPTQPQAESPVQSEQPAAATPAPAPKPRVVVRPQVKPPTLPLFSKMPRLPLAKPIPKRTRITVDPAILARYAGTYELAPGFLATVTHEEGRLAPALQAEEPR